MKPIHLIIISCVLFIYACDGQSNKGKDKKPDQVEAPKTINPPAFNKDSAYYFVQKQVEFGPRVPNSIGHINCGDWLFSKLQQYTDTVYEQRVDLKAFNGTILKSRNLIGSINPDNKKRVLLCAHWDTRPFADQDTKDKSKPILGANDGASGVAVLLELARIMQLQNPGIGVDFILFDSEDYGSNEHEDSYCLGSQYWAKNPHVPGYRANYGILLDMVGAKNATFAREGVSEQFASDIVNRVWTTASRLGYGNYFINYNRGGIIDDHYYVNQLAQIPTIDIIHYDPNTPSGFGKYWHTHDDNLESVDPQTLLAVGATVAWVVYN